MIPPDQPEKKEPCRMCDGVGGAIEGCPCSRCEGARRHDRHIASDAPKAMGEGPCQIEAQGDCFAVIVGNIGLEMFCPGQMKRETPDGAATRYAEALNAQILSWLKAKGWAAPEEARQLREGLESHAWEISPAMAQAKIDELNRSLSALKEQLKIMANSYHDLFCVPDIPHHVRRKFKNCSMGYCHRNRELLGAYAKAEGGK